MPGDIQMWNPTIFRWALLLALPAQYCVFLGLTLYELNTARIRIKTGDGQYGCYNFHQEGLWSCSFTEMLLNPLYGIIIVNLYTLGIAFVISAGLVALLLVGVRASRGRLADN